MIPYIHLNAITIFGLELQPFFFLVAAGIVAGVVVYDRICRRGGLIDRKTAHHLPEIAVLGGFIGAHFVHVLLYKPDLLLEDPWVLFKIWGGISSIGGFFGGMLAVVLYLKKKNQPVMPYADRIAVALSIGWLFGRTGCALAHDHLGEYSDSFFAVQFPSGSRFDLGLLEQWLTVIILIAIFVVSSKARKSGTHLALVLLIYSPARFLMDFLRVTEGKLADERYLGLTPAQYGTIAMALTGLYIALTLNRRDRDVSFRGKMSGHSPDTMDEESR